MISSTWPIELNLLEPFYHGHWPLFLERAKCCESFSEAVNYLRDQLFDHPVDDARFWSQIEDAADTGSREMSTEDFEKLMALIFVSGLFRATDSKAPSDDLLNEQVRVLRKVSTVWNPAVANLSDIRPWLLAPRLFVLVDEVLAQGAETDLGYWTLSLLKEGAPLEIAAHYARRIPSEARAAFYGMLEEEGITAESIQGLKASLTRPVDRHSPVSASGDIESDVPLR